VVLVWVWAYYWLLEVLCFGGKNNTPSPPLAVLFVDSFKVEGNSCEAQYYVDPNLPFFQGHFPDYPFSQVSCT